MLKNLLIQKSFSYIFLRYKLQKSDVDYDIKFSMFKLIFYKNQ